MDKSTNDYVSIYHSALQKGDIQIAYGRLVKYVMALCAHFSKRTNSLVWNVSPGYLDYTYFPFFNEFLREKKLRFGIVLNHLDMRFELWLMGQNAVVQSAFWARLKGARWNRHRLDMPKYAVLEAVLVDIPDFDDPERLTAMLELAALELADEILPYLS